MKIAVLSVLFLALVTSVATAGEFPVTVHEKTLDNGLKILVVPRKGMPTCPMAVAYGVGSVNERPGRTGLAHYLEHMMFKGTKKTGVKDLAADAKLRQQLDEVIAETIRLEDGPQTSETAGRLFLLAEERARLIEEQKANLEINHLFKIYREAGSTFTNAMTSNDRTVYIAALPPEKIELFFWVEADRLANIVFRQFHAEKDVVREERRMYENRPGAHFNEAIDLAFFGSHPYSHGVLGSHADLRRLTRTELRAFWSKYYSVDNATIFVGGDVDPEQVFALAERYFGPMTPSTTPRPRIPTLPTSGGGEIRMHGRGPGRDRLEIRFRAPAANSAESVALSFLASYLGDPEGELSKDLVERESIAVNLRASYDAMKYGGALSITATIAPTGTHEAAEKRITAELTALARRTLNDTEMARLRRGYRARVLGSVRNDMMLGFVILSREMNGSWRDIERDLASAGSLPAAAIRDAVQNYATEDNRLVATYSKGEREERTTPGAPATPAPPPAPPLAAKKPAIPESYEDLEYEKRTFTLPSGPDARRELGNGMRAFIVTNEGDPVVRVSARVLGGSIEDPAGKEGLSDLAAAVLGEAGVPEMNAEVLRDRLEGMVADLSVTSGADAHTVTITVFPSDLNDGLWILHALLTVPVPEAEAFERIRNAMISRIEASESRLGGVTRRLFGDLTWGDVPETRRATRESLMSITLDDVRARLAAVTGPARIILAASGDRPVDDLVARLDVTFGTWKPEGVAKHSPRAEKNDPAAAKRGLHLRGMATSQGSVRIGGITVPRTHADVPALRVLSTVLSRRIFNQVRSVHGLSYQATARFSPNWRNDSPFSVTFQTKCGSVPFAVHLAKEELAKMIATGPSEAELTAAKGSLDSGFRRTLGTGFAAAETFAELAGRGVDLGYYDQVRAAYAAVTVKDVTAVAEKYLDPAQLLILCVGDVEAMRAGDGIHENRLGDYGEATVHTPDTPAKAAPTTPDAIAMAMIECLKAGDLDGFKAHLSKELHAKLEANPQSSMQLTMFPKMFGAAKFSDPEVKEEDGAAVVTTTTKYGPAARDITFAFRMAKEDGTWKCADFGVKRPDQEKPDSGE